MQLQTSTTILNAIQKRGQRELPLSNSTYRLLYNPDLYERAYAKIYRNHGSLTPGPDEETADGTSQEKIGNIINATRNEKYRWKPARRTYIPKANGKRRPLGIPAWSDKLLQEVIRSLLEAYYEPQFSNLSHGFRPNRGCHTALQTVQRTWTGSKWFIEGDIEGYFDNIDHEILMEILGRSIKDNRLLTLLRRFLAAGYLEEDKRTTSISGTPQGGILSPLLSNIYLNELDTYVETVLIPNNTKGIIRGRNPKYQRLSTQRRKYRKHGNTQRIRELNAEIRQLPSKDPHDPNYRRLRYVRYADDFLISYVGSKREAVQIKDQLTTFLRDNLKLELNQDKTLVTHAGSQPARFLGYEIQPQKANHKIGPTGRRSVNGKIGLRVPQSTINTYVREYTQGGKPTHKSMLTLESDYAIVEWYGRRLRGITQYYKLAWNISHLWRLVGYMQLSLLRTLAYKHQSSIGKMWAKYKTHKYNELGQKVRSIEVIAHSKDGTKTYVARFGGISLKRDKNAVLYDITLQQYTDLRSDLLDRLKADTCEMCGVKGNIEVHHIHALKDLNVKGQRQKKPWEIKMSAMRRKTLMVCRPCHQDITHGRF